jgi:trigger factor
MNVTETLSQGLKREYKVVIPAQDLQAKYSDKLAKLTQNIRLPGFRPGKVPPALLRKRYGDALATEVVEEAVSETASKAMTDKGLRPALQPKLLEVGKFEEGKDLEFRFAVEALPDIEPMDFRQLALERVKVGVEETDVDAALTRLREGNPDLNPAPADRKAEKGDVAVIDFAGTIGGVAFPGGSAEGHHLKLGGGGFIPGFEDQLIGAAAGEKREVKVTFPAEYPAKNLAGKEAAFAVTVKELKQPVTAEANDAFAERVGAKDLADLKGQIRKQIEGDYASLARMRLKRQLLDKLAEGHGFAVPEGMVEAEFNLIWREVEEQKKQGQMDEADKAKPEEELKAEYRKIAERRVRLGLLLAEVGKRNKIEVSREELGQAIVREAQRYPGQERKVIDYYQQNQEALAQLRAPLYEDKVVDYILALAKISEKSVTPKELTALAEAEAAEKSAGEKPEAEGEEKGKKKRASEKKR